jgi:putative acyl-CoA dehydrogenase
MEYDALFAEIHAGSSGDSCLKEFAVGLEREIDQAGDDVEPHARRLMGMAAMALQASLLRRYAPAEVADLFAASRLDPEATTELGTLPCSGAVLTRVAERAVPDQ